MLSVSILSYSGYLSSPKDRPKGVCANYDQQKNVITVTCNSTFSELHNTIADDNLLKKETSEGIWFLNSSVVVSKDAVLTINNKDVKWIKINSEGRSSGKHQDQLRKQVDPSLILSRFLADLTYRE